MVEDVKVTEDDILEACRDFHAGIGPPCDEALAGKYPRESVMAKMEEMSDKGMLNWGVSLRTAWVEEDMVRRMRRAKE